MEGKTGGRERKKGEREGGREGWRKKDQISDARKAWFKDTKQIRMGSYFECKYE